MTALLVSVRDAAEARLAHAAGARLIDAKDPARGALGPLSRAAVSEILAALPVGAETSAVAGDSADPDELADAARALAATGVSFVKLGLPREVARTGPIADIGARLAGAGRFVAVVFADEGADASLVRTIAAASFTGAMLDTRDKRAGRLTDCMGRAALAAFVEACRAERLLCGLAGSLQLADIAPLAPIGADYLGFRGGLCVGGDRRNALDPTRIGRAVAGLAQAQVRGMAGGKAA